MARRKKAKKEDDVGQDTRFWNVGSHHPACSCFECRKFLYSKHADYEPQAVQTTIPNTLNARVAKAACDRSIRLQDFYLKLIERGLKSLEFDKI